MLIFQMFADWWYSMAQAFRLDSLRSWRYRKAGVIESTQRVTGMESWVVLQRRRKWRLAGHAARRTDGRWSHLIFGLDSDWWQERSWTPSNKMGDDLDHFFAPLGYSAGSWMEFGNCNQRLIFQMVADWRYSMTQARRLNSLRSCLGRPVT